LYTALIVCAPADSEAICSVAEAESSNGVLAVAARLELPSSVPSLS
jgi:hypothetical protein